MIQLPTTKTAAVTKSPRKLLIYSQPKVGKTSLVAQLNDCLLLDLENGSGQVEAMRMHAKTFHDIKDITDAIIAANKPYRYIAVDTATALEDICIPLALALYQQTPMGKAYKGHILALPNGGGYLYLRQAYSMLIEMIESAADRVVLLGHLKDKFLEKAGKEVSAKDIDLTGKLKAITCANADAIGYLYREGNKNILSFETTEDIICGARSAHLRNKKFVVSEYNEKTDTVVTNWDQIYID